MKKKASQKTTEEIAVEEETVIVEETVEENEKVEVNAEYKKETKAEKEKKENLFLKKLLTYLVLFLILGGVVTALSAVLPKLPFTVTKTEELYDLSYGFPLPFAEQERTPEQLKPLLEKDFNKAFILPRYDLHETRFNPVTIVADVVLNALWIGLIGLLAIFFPKVAKKTLKYVLISLLFTLLIALFPAVPGTFTVDTLEPMHFGFPLKFLEQTPDLAAAYMTENLEEILQQTFLSPKLFGQGTERYVTHIVGYKLLLSVLLNAFVLGAFVNLIRVIKLMLKGDGKAVSVYYKDRWNALVLRPLDKKALLPEKASLKLKANIKALSSESPKTLKGKKK